MRARIITYGLLGLLAFFLATQSEWWPLSAFKLFSQARTAASTSWEVALVDKAGDEHVVPFERLPRGYRGVHQLAPGLGRLPAGRREAVCQAWAAAGARELDIRATEVRIYRVAARVPAGGGAPALVSRTRTTTCGRAGP